MKLERGQLLTMVRLITIRADYRIQQQQLLLSPFHGLDRDDWNNVENAVCIRKSAIDENDTDDDRSVEHEI